jgi:hypothetical protein
MWGPGFNSPYQEKMKWVGKEKIYKYEEVLGHPAEQNGIN